MTTATTTRADVLAYIAAHATQDDLDAFSNALTARQKTLDATHAATLTVGTPVTLAGLSPKYLEGSTGKVQRISGTRADVLLDKNSTARLAARRTRFYVPVGTEEFLLLGVPLTACRSGQD